MADADRVLERRSAGDEHRQADQNQLSPACGRQAATPERRIQRAQHDRDQRKRERIGEYSPVLAESLDYILADTDYKRTDYRAGDRPDAAENSRNEGLQAWHCTGSRYYGRIV